MLNKFFRPNLIIGTLPVTLANGTTADATQVMSDLNYIVNQINANAAPLASPTFTGTVTTAAITASGLITANAGISLPSGALGNCYSATYTPSAMTGKTNISADTPQLTNYIRIGNYVQVSGEVLFTPTSAGPITTKFELNLPIASTLGQTYTLSGSGASLDSTAAQISGSVANNTAAFTFTLTTAGAQRLTYTYGYRII